MYHLREYLFCMFRFSRILLVISLTALTSITASAQKPTAQTPKPIGLAMIKPQVWSPNSQASLMEFSAIDDRTAVGNMAAGYYQFQTLSGQQRQIPAGRVVKLILYPDLKRISEVIEPSDRQRIENTLKDLEKTTADFPATKSYLQPHIQALAGEISQFNAGKIKIQGAWILRSEYEKIQGRKITNQLISEINSANPPGSFDLTNDPKFQVLQKMASSNPAIQPLVEEVTSSLQAGARSERRKAIIKSLKNPSTPPDECRRLLDELASLKPEEDPASEQFLKKWKSLVTELDQLNATAKSLADDLDAALKSSPSPTQIQFSDVLLFRLETFAKDWNRLCSQPIARQLFSPENLAHRLALSASALQQAPELIAQRKIFEAKTLLDEASPTSGSLGQNISRALTELQGKVNTQIEAFIAARNEGKAHLEAGRNQQAADKFREALAIADDASLRKTLETINPPQNPAQ